MSIRAIGTQQTQIGLQPRDPATEAKGGAKNGGASSTDVVSTATTTNADGSITTITTYANGTTSTTTTAPTGQASAGTEKPSTGKLTPLLDGRNGAQLSTLLSAQEQAKSAGAGLS